MHVLYTSLLAISHFAEGAASGVMRLNIRGISGDLLSFLATNRRQFALATLFSKGLSPRNPGTNKRALRSFFEEDALFIGVNETAE